MTIILSITAAFTITFILLPIIIKVSRSIDLLDAPDKRKIHSVSTPALGGIAIFIGFMIATSMTIPFHLLGTLKFLFFGLIIIFLMGLRDDISSLLAKHKLFAQVFATVLIVYFGEIRLDGFYGMFGIDNMPDWFDVSFSMFTIVALTNSFNLIDGIDGLAGSVAILILSFFGIFFLSINDLALAILSFSVVGSLFAFLFFNWHPSKIFMGDTGSMILGYIISSLAIVFINKSTGFQYGYIEINSSVAVAIAALIIPIFDTTRVFTIRFVNGKNPLDPDRNHLHHGLLKLGFSHSKATIILVTINVVILLIALALTRFMGNGLLFLVILFMALAASSVLDFKLMRKKYLGRQHSVVSKGQDLYISKSA